MASETRDSRTPVPPPRLSQPGEMGPEVGADELDPELLALPSPPRAERTRTLVLLALTAIASVAMVLALAKDVTYALGGGHAAADLGELKGADSAAFVANSFVCGKAMPGAAGAMRFERPFESDSFRLLPLSGRPDVWVEVRVPQGTENSRYVPPTSFCGRLVRFDDAGLRHRGLGDAFAQVNGRAVPPGAWLLVDGEQPRDARWAAALAALFAAFAVWNVVVIVRLVRPVR